MPDAINAASSSAALATPHADVLSGVASGVAGLPASAAQHAPLLIGSAVPSLGLGGIVQAVLGLILVIAAVFACGWAARRFGLQSVRRGGLVKVVGAASLGAREKVVVVEVANTWLVLGVASGSVRRLHTLPAQHADGAGAAYGNPSVMANPSAMTDAPGAPAPSGDPAAPPSFQTAFAQQLRARLAGFGKTRGKD